MVDVVEIESPPSAETKKGEKVDRTRGRALNIPSFPSVLCFDAHGRITLADTKQLCDEFVMHSQVIEERGAPGVYLQRIPRLFPSTMPVVLLTLLAAIIAVISSIMYNLTCADDSRLLRVIGIAVTNIGINTGVTLMLISALIQQYPAALRNRAIRVTVTLCYIPYIILHALHWALSKTKTAFYNSEKTLAQSILSVISEGPGFWLALIVPYELCRYYWRRQKRRSVAGNNVAQITETTTTSERMTKTFRTRFLSQSGVLHSFTYLLHLVLFIGVVLIAFNVVTAFVARALCAAIAAVIIPYILYSLSRPENETLVWSGGYAFFFGNSQFMTLVLANLLPVIMAMFGDNVVWTLIKFFAYYLLYGVFFSGFQIIIGHATEQYHSPQFLFILQVFLDAFLGLMFVELRTPTQYWTLLILQSIWGLFRSTGMYSWLYLLCKDAIVRSRGHVPHHSREELLQRDLYFYYLNTQSSLSDVICGALIPALFAIDFALPFGYRSVSAVFNAAQLSAFINRYLILLAFRIGSSIIVFAVYCIRYTTVIETSSLSFKTVLKTARSLWLAFNLYVWRNFLILFGVCVYLFSYLLFVVIGNHGFGNESSDNSSFSLV